jgi:hypothetical protein
MQIHKQKLNRLLLFKQQWYFSCATTACLADRVRQIIVRIYFTRIIEFWLGKPALEEGLLYCVLNKVSSYFLQNYIVSIIRIVGCRKLRCGGRVARMGVQEMHTEY